MTHKNIVRYYQAWVEGNETDDTIVETSVENRQSSSEDVKNTANLLDNGGENDAADNGDGWWTSPPDDCNGLNQVENDFNNSDDSSSDSSEWDDTSNLGDNNEVLRRDLHSDSVVNLLEHENDYILQVSNVSKSSLRYRCDENFSSALN